MGEILCVDGSILSVVAVACRDRLGEPYEITLELARDRVPFAAVGERCGSRLSRLAAQVSAAREDPGQAAVWADPDDRFPEPQSWNEHGHGHGHGPPCGASLESYLPGDREYLSLRARERTDLPGAGELRCCLRASAEWLSDDGSPAPAGTAPAGTGPADGRLAGAQPADAGQACATQACAAQACAAPAGATPAYPWQAGPWQAGPWQAGPWQAGPWQAGPWQAGPWQAGPEPGGPGAPRPGRWRLTRRAVIEAWGNGGIGVRAILTSAELVTFLDTVLREPGVALAGLGPASATTAGKQLGAGRRPARRQRGRVPDGFARSCLPALRAPARSVPVASGDPQARGSDVRR